MKQGGELLHLRGISLVLESTYEGTVGSAIGDILAPVILYWSTDSYQKIFGFFPADVVAILHDIPI